MKKYLVAGMIVFFSLAILFVYPIIKVTPTTGTHYIVGLLCFIITGIYYVLIKLQQIIEMMKKNKEN